jgi:hypothetical protein
VSHEGSVGLTVDIRDSLGFTVPILGAFLSPLLLDFGKGPNYPGYIGA